MVINKLLASLSILFAIACAPGVATASVVDFQNTSGSFGLSSTYSNQGLTFQTAGPQYVYANGAGANNGTQYFIESGGVTVTADGGATFSLNAFDTGLSYYTGSAGTVQVLGNLLGGGTVSKTLNLTQTFQSVSFSGFNNLTSFYISPVSNGGYLALDNIRFNELANASAVPEPGSLALLALGLAGVGALRRGKRVLAAND